MRHFLRDEKGSVAQMVWVIGAAVVTGLALMVAIKLMPGFAEQIWNTLTSWVSTQLGLLK